MNLRRSCGPVLAALLFFGCGGNAASPLILSAEDEAAARGWLREHVSGINDHEFELSAGLQKHMESTLAALAEQVDTVAEPSVLMINNPDADVGCIASGQIFLSIGLFSFIEHPDELAGALALAMTACGEANEDWRRRARARLPELDLHDPLMTVYRDLRLNEQAALYRQLVRIGCDQGIDCQRQAQAWLRSAGSDPAGMDRLLARIGENWPDAAIIFRFDGYPESPGAASGDAQFLALTEPFTGIRELLGHVRDARWILLTGELIEAYRANLQALVMDLDSWLPDIMQVRLDLANIHPEYSLRDLNGILRDVYHDKPSLDLYMGIARWQRHRLDEAIQYLESSIEARPTVSGHYYLGRIAELRREPDRALNHFRAASQAGDIHPYGRDAAARLEALEAEVSRPSRR